MKKTFAIALFAVALAGCSSTGSVESSTAKKQLQEKYEKKVGTASKQDLIQDLGPASWCKQDEGTETCRFYKKLDTKWAGDKKDRVHRETYDEVIAEFDAKGVLRSFEASAQR